MHGDGYQSKGQIQKISPDFTAFFFGSFIRKYFPSILKTVCKVP